MARELYIPNCRCEPMHPHHFPPPDKPLRIQIEGPLTSVQKLAPGFNWSFNTKTATEFPHPASYELARVTYRKIYGKDPDGEMNVRDQYMGWIAKKLEIDYYGVTFDNLVPADDLDPEVLQINITEMDYDDGAYAKQVLPFPIDPAEYIGKVVYALPRCCQRRKGTTDRARVNEGVQSRLGLDPYGLKNSLQQQHEGEGTDKVDAVT